MLSVPKQNCHPERSRGICGAPFGLPKFWSSHADSLARPSEMYWFSPGLNSSSPPLNQRAPTKFGGRTARLRLLVLTVAEAKPKSGSVPRLCQHDLESAYEASRRHRHIHDLHISRVCEIGHLQIGSNPSLGARKRDVPDGIGSLLEPLNDSETRIQ